MNVEHIISVGKIKGMGRGWGNSEAQVVCRQLGLDLEGNLAWCVLYV